ncbi:MAG: SMP-30/gluconolactonase/LRE family protein [Planctomycetota bacterium]|nr:SMP-30/gluconolactonase/LRE family protein [Planctomycetota bacterium]
MRIAPPLLLLVVLLPWLPAPRADAEDPPAGKAADPAKAPPAQAPRAVCAKDAVFERVATGFRFTEGPAADAEGHVFFSDIPNERIHRFDITTGKTTVFREQSGRANGLMFDTAGALVACEGGRRQVVRIQGETATVLASHWKSKRLNSPNDLALDAHGGVWFTDPRYGRRQDDREIDVEAVYYRDAQGGVTQMRASPLLVKPNGILLARDGRTLYVAASRGKKVLAYAVTRPGVLAAPRVFATMDLEARGGPDGMCLDARGNVYAAGQNHIWVWAPDGKPIAKLPVPEGPANCTFGGPARRTLYVTARTSLYRMPMLVVGAPVVPAARSVRAAPGEKKKGAAEDGGR